MSPMIMPIVVVLPAPLPPRSPVTEPRAIANVNPSTATTPLYVLTRLMTSIAGSGAAPSVQVGMGEGSCMNLPSFRGDRVDGLRHSTPASKNGSTDPGFTVSAARRLGRIPIRPCRPTAMSPIPSEQACQPDLPRRVESALPPRQQGGSRGGREERPRVSTNERDRIEGSTVTWVSPLALPGKIGRLEPLSHA